MTTPPRNRKILITGASGYVGGRLVRTLVDEDFDVRVFVRDHNKIKGQPWASEVEICEGTANKVEDLARALEGIHTAYYLLHSINLGKDFDEIEAAMARQFAQVAQRAGVQQIVYLGGIANDKNISKHLASRVSTGAELASTSVTVMELRAGIIIGSGSASFEMLRHLTHRLPIMTTPKWVMNKTHPIAIRDILYYLKNAATLQTPVDKVFDIGGPEVLTYADMMTGYARARGLKRRLIAVPVLTPRLSSYWVHLVTPIPANIAQPLIKGLGNEVIVRDDTARRLFPGIEPMGFDAAVRLALARVQGQGAETAWSDALTSSQGNRIPRTLLSREGLIIERRQKIVSFPADAVYRSFAQLGGCRGWLYMNWAWQLRGMADRLCGGVGMRRGRRDPEDLRVGETLDFWRVEMVEPGRLIRLRAEMKVPGRAWLEFEARPESDRQTQLLQTAFFEPKGLLGLLYWYALYPIHSLIFNGLIRKIADGAKFVGPDEN